jgi:hypothetical protein
MMFACIMFRATVSRPKMDTIETLTKQAPVVKDVKPGWHDQLFNGSFLHENQYRQAAGPEVDAAWAALGVDCERRPARVALQMTNVVRSEHCCCRGRSCRDWTAP